MVIAPLVHRTGPVVLVLQGMKWWDHNRRPSAALVRYTAPGERPGPDTRQALWDEDEGEPTWEDAEWQ